MPTISLPAILFFAVLPTLALAATGILIIVFGRGAWDISAGILVLNFTLIGLIGSIIGLVLLYRARSQRLLQVDFLAKVSHELRTPLSSIRMFVDTLQQESLSEPDRATCLTAISSETSRLSSMIEGLLSWGRMESGKRVYEMHPERVDTLIAEALAQAEVQLRDSGARVELELPPDCPAIQADRRAFVEALLNLIRNAISYGASGGVLILRVRNQGRRVAIEVEDHGPGIPRKEHRRIFDRFYRGSSARLLGTHEGSGLGLAMVRHLVRAHGGRVLLTSREGEGARFTILLKALPSKAALRVEGL